MPVPCPLSCSYAVRPCGGEHGVFAIAPIDAASVIMSFTGAIYRRQRVLDAARRGEHDGFLQVALNRFIGLSGDADDYVNHACDPNCYVAIADSGVQLRARRTIAPGEELSFDYRVTQVDFPLRFACRCGAAACGGDIGNCDEIPPRQLAQYLAEGIVPAWVSSWLAAREPASVPLERLDVVAQVPGGAEAREDQR